MKGFLTKNLGVRVVVVAFAVSAAVALSFSIATASSPQGIAKESINTTGGSMNTGEPGSFLSYLYNWFLLVVGVSALYAFVRGGITYMLAGSITSTAEAKKWIINGISGLLLAAASYLLLATINPDLVEHNFDFTKVIQSIQERYQPPASQPGTPTQPATPPEFPSPFPSP